MRLEILTQDMYTSRNKMKKIFLAIAVLIGSQVLAQQNPTMDNYLFNPVSISPAYAGQQNGQIQSIYDAQWIGLKGAPRTGAMYYDYMSPNRFGFNLGVVDDQVGPMRTQSLGISTAYHLQVADQVYFSTGIRYSIAKTGVDFLMSSMSIRLTKPSMISTDLGFKTWTCLERYIRIIGMSGRR